MCVASVRLQGERHVGRLIVDKVDVFVAKSV